MSGWSEVWPEKEGYYWACWLPRNCGDKAVQARWGLVHVRGPLGNTGRKAFMYLVNGTILFKEEVCALWKPARLPKMPPPGQLWGMKGL